MYQGLTCTLSKGPVSYSLLLGSCAIHFTIINIIGGEEHQWLFRCFFRWGFIISRIHIMCDGFSVSQVFVCNHVTRRLYWGSIQ